MKGNQYTHIIVDECQHMDQRFKRSRISSAMSGQMEMSYDTSMKRAAIEAGRDTGKPLLRRAMLDIEFAKAPESPLFDFNLAQESMKQQIYDAMGVPERLLGQTTASGGSDVFTRLELGKEKEWEFNYDSIAKVSLDIEHSMNHTEAVKFITWLTCSIRQFGFTSLEEAREAGYKFLTLESLAFRNPFDTKKEKEVVILTPMGDKFDSYVITERALLAANALFDKEVD
ncbi:hypothetical protein ACZ98_23745 (plasmid) [Vibrio parahaemolyticus]|nr:hypothetical protein ACZ98_23745 [Vibrio parahaemolyticus]